MDALENIFKKIGKLVILIFSTFSLVGIVVGTFFGGKWISKIIGEIIVGWIKGSDIFPISKRFRCEDNSLREDTPEDRMCKIIRVISWIIGILLALTVIRLFTIIPLIYFSNKPKNIKSDLSFLPFY